MKKSILFIVFAVVSQTFLFPQAAPIRDHWDTLYKSVTTTYVDTMYYSQEGNMAFGNNLFIYGDSIDEFPNYAHRSFFQLFNTSNNTLSSIHYPRFSSDRGISCGASIQTSTPGITYVFFGVKGPEYEMLDSTLVLYRYDNSSNGVLTETIQCGHGDFRKNALAMAFFSPGTGNDSLIIFNHNYYDTISIFKKHYNQSGLIDSHIKLSIDGNLVSQPIIFQNALYFGVSGGMSGNEIINTTDGTTFTVNAGFASSTYTNLNITHMDTLNGQLYISLYDGDGGHQTIKTSDGVNYSLVESGTGEIQTLKHFQKKLFYVINDQVTSTSRPTIFYFDPADNNILSIDTLGRPSNDAYTSDLVVANNKLFMTNNYMDYFNYNFGTFVYQFLPPVANFVVSNTTICEFDTKTFISQSLNADSVRWVKDGNFYASTSTTFATSFSGTGSHTIGLIAIAGTQKDTLLIPINVYSINLTVMGPTGICLNSQTNFSGSAAGAIGQFTYAFGASSGLTGTGGITSIIAITGTTTGTYSYNVFGYDGNGCYANSPTYTVNVLPSKDIIGVATESSNGVDGQVVLYKYQPMLTKFDSIAHQPTDAAGGYTFSSVDANTYLVRIFPTSNTLFVTYAPNAEGWKDASIITHGCVNNTNANIQVQALPNIGTGPGLLAGKIVEGVGYGQRGQGVLAPGNPIGGLMVKGGKNPGGNIVTQGRTNSAGEYSLTNLPATAAGESYFILVDVPGLDTIQTYYRSIDETNNAYTDLDFVIDSAYIRPTNDVGFREIKMSSGIISIYPNPTSGNITIQTSLKQGPLADIGVYDITGKLVKNLASEKLSFNSNQTNTFDLNNINNGVYFIRFKIGEEQYNTKLIISK